MSNVQRNPSFWLIALLALAACEGDRAPPEGTLDLRPRYAPGLVIEVREERTLERGRGPFPAAGEVAARAEMTERSAVHYRDEVLEGAGPRLRKVRREYLRATRTVDGRAENAPVAGVTYEIAEPFGACRAEVATEGQVPVPVAGKEIDFIRAGIPRIAASLLPAGPVAPGETWVPGRDARALLALGQTGVRMRAKLTSVTGDGPARIATVLGETDVQAVADGVPTTAVLLRETLRMDVSAGRMLSFESVSERHGGPTGLGEERWERTTLRAEFQYPAHPTR